MTIAWRIFLSLQTASICLRIDHVLEWQWSEVFWLYWVLFAFMLGFNLGLILIIANKWIHGLKNPHDSNESKRKEKINYFIKDN